MKRQMSEARHDECKNKPHYFEMFLSEADKTKETIVRNKPKKLRLLWNFAKAVTKYVYSGLKNVSEKVYKERLSVCETCVFRQNDKCLHKSCGCSLTEKAQWKSEECPEGKWKE